jgi:TP901 family phage tail tape measure protein
MQDISYKGFLIIMPFSIKIEIENFKAFQSQLNQYSRILNTIENLAKKNEAAFTQFENAVGKANNALTGNLNQIERVSAKMLDLGKDVLVIDGIFEKIGKGTEDSSLAKLPAILSRIGDEIPRLKPEIIRDFTNALRALDKIVDAAFLANMNLLVNVFNDLSSASGQIDEISRAFTKIGNSFAKLKEFLGANENIRAPGEAIASAFKTIIGAFRELTEVSGLSKKIESITKPINTFANALTKLAQSFATNNIDTLKTDIRDIVNILDVPEAKTTGLKDFSNAVRALAQIIFETQTALKPVGDETLNERLNAASDSFTRVIRFISDIIKQVAKISDIRRVDKIRAVSTAVRSITQIMEELRVLVSGKVVAGGSGLQEIDVSMEAILRVARSIVPLSKILNKAIGSFSKIRAPGSVRAVSGAIRSVKEIIEVIFNLAGTLFDEKSLGRANQIVAQLNKFEGGENVFQKVYNFVQRQRGRGGLVELLPNLQGLFKLIAKSVSEFSGIEKPGNIRVIGETVGSIGLFINSISVGLDEIVNINPSVLQRISSFISGRRGLTQQFSKLPAVFRVLAKSVSEFTKIKVGQVSLSELGYIAKFIESVGRLLPQLEQVGVAKGFKGDVLKKITPALVGMTKQFAKLAKGLDDTSLAKLTKLAEALRRFGDTIQKVSSAATTGVDFSKVVNQFKELGASLPEGLAKGIAGDGDKAIKSIRDVSQAVIKSSKREFKSQSPSRVFIDIAKDVVTGFIKGITSSLPKMALSGAKLAVSFVKGFTDKFRESTREFTRLQAEIARDFKQFGDSLIQTGLQRITTGGVAGFFQSQAVTFAADFGQIIKQIQVFGGVGIDALDDIQNAILEFSAATIFSPLQSAEALLGLQKAGLDTATALEALPIIGNLAAAANLDLSTTTDLAIQSLFAFGLEIGDLADITDAWVGAADISTASVESLAAGMSFAAPSASALGISIQEVSTAMALLSDTGIVGERAGTGLRALFDAIAAPTDEAKRSLEDLGLEVKDFVDESTGEFKSLEDVLALFADGIAGLKDDGQNAQEVFEVLSGLGSRNAVTALLALTTTAEDGSLAFSDYALALEGANSAQTVAASLMDTFKGRVTSLVGSVQTLLIRAMLPLLDALTPVVDAMISAVNALSKLPKPILAAVSGGALLATVLLTLSGVAALFAGILVHTIAPGMFVIAKAFQLAHTYVFNLGAAFRVIAAVLTTLIPLLAIVVAFIATLAALAAAAATVAHVIRNDFGGAGQSVARLLENIGGLINDVIDTFNLFADVVGNITSGVDGLSTSGSILAPILNVIGLAIAFVVDRANEAVTTVRAFIGEINKLILLVEEAFISVGLASPRQEDSPALDDLQARRDEINKQIEELAAADETYLIKSGDTLSAIAREYGLTVEDILAANDKITDRDVIRAGDTLVIPGVGDTAEQVEDLAIELDKVNRQIAAAEDLKNLPQTFRSLRDVMLDITQNGAFIAIFGNVSAQQIDEIIGKLRLATLQVGFLAFAFTQTATKALALFKSGDVRGAIEELERGTGDLAKGLIRVAEQAFDIDLGDTFIGKATEDGIQSALIGAFSNAFDGLQDFIIKQARVIFRNHLLKAFKVSSFISILGADFLLQVLGFTGFKEALLPIRADTIAALESIVDAIFNKIVDVDKNFQDIAAAIVAVLSQLAVSMLTFIGTVIVNLDLLLNGSIDLFQFLGRTIRAAYAEISRIPVAQILKFITKTFGKLFSEIGKQINSGLKKLINLAVSGIAGNILEGIFRIIGLEGVADFIDDAFEDIADVINRGVDNILQSFFTEEGAGFNFIVGGLEAIASVLKTIADIAFDEDVTLLTVLADILEGITDADYSSLFGVFEDIGGDILDGLASGIGDLFQFGIDLFQELIDGVKDVLGISSPSTEFADIGKDTATGFENGLTRVISATAKIFNAVIAEAGRILSNGVLSLLGINEGDFALLQDDIDALRSELSLLGDDLSALAESDAVTESINLITESLEGLNSAATLLIEAGGDILNILFPPSSQGDEATRGLSKAADALSELQKSADDAKRDVPLAIKVISGAIQGLTLVVSGLRLAIQGLVSIINIIASIVSVVLRPIVFVLSRMLEILSVVAERFYELGSAIVGAFSGLNIGEIVTSLIGLGAIIAALAVHFITWTPLLNFAGFGLAALYGNIVAFLPVAATFLLWAGAAIIIFEVIVRTIGPLVDAFASVFQSLSAIGIIIVALATFNLPLLQFGLEQLIGASYNFFDAIVRLNSGIVAGIADGIATIIELVTPVINLLLGIVGINLDTSGIVNFFRQLADIIASISLDSVLGLLTSIGRAILTFLAPVLDVIGERLAVFIERGRAGLNDLLGSLSNLGDSFGNLGAAIGGALTKLAEFLSPVIGPAIAGALATLASLGIAATLYQIGVAISAVATGAISLADAFAFVGFSFGSASVNIAPIIALLKEILIIFGQFVLAVVVFEVLSRTIEGLFGVLSGFVDILAGIINLLAALISGDYDAFNDALDEIGNGFLKIAKSLFEIQKGLAAGVVDALATIIELFAAVAGVDASSVVDSIRDFADSIANITIDDIVSVGESIANGLVEGISSIPRLIRSKVYEWIVAPFKSMLQIASPSKIFVGIGDDTMRGLLLGLQRGANAIVQFFRGLFSDVLYEAAQFLRDFDFNPLESFIESTFDIDLPSLNGLAEFVANIADAFGGLLETGDFAQFGQDIVQSLVDLGQIDFGSLQPFADFFSQIGDSIGGLLGGEIGLSEFGTQITDAFKSLFDNLDVSGTATSVKSFLLNALAQALTFGDGLLDSAVDLATPILNFISGQLTGLNVEEAAELIHNLGNNIGNIIVSAISSIADLSAGALGTAVDLATPILEIISSSLSGFDFSQAGELTAKIIIGIVGAIGAALLLVGSVAETVAPAALELAKSLFTAIATTLSNITFEDIQDTAVTIVEAFVGFIVGAFAAYAEFQQGFAEGFKPVTDKLLEAIGEALGSIDFETAGDAIQGGLTAIVDTIFTPIKETLDAFGTAKDDVINFFSEIAAGQGIVANFVSGIQASFSLFFATIQSLFLSVMLVILGAVEKGLNDLINKIPESLREELGIGTFDLTSKLQEELNKSNLEVSVDAVLSEGQGGIQKAIDDALSTGDFELIGALLGDETANLNIGDLVNVIPDTEGQLNFLNALVGNLGDLPEEQRTELQGQISTLLTGLLSDLEFEPTQGESRILQSLITGLLATDTEIEIPPEVSQGIKDLLDRTFKAILNAPDGTLGDEAGATSAFSAFSVGVAESIVAGLQQGFDENVAGIESASQALSEPFQNSINNLFGIFSPSLWAYERGLAIVEGLGLGIIENVGLIDAPVMLLTAKIQGIENAVRLMVEKSVINMRLLSREFGIGAINIVTQSNIMINALLLLANAAQQAAEGISGAANAAQSLPGAGGGGSSGGSGGPQVPGRAFGGSTNPLSIYRIAERGEPEIYSDGRSGYLITPNRAGYVSPVAVPPQQQISNATNNIRNTSNSVLNINVDLRNLSIENPTGTEITPDIIADGITIAFENNPSIRDLRNNR